MGSVIDVGFRSPKRGAFSLIVAAALLAAAVGCGSKDEGSSDDPVASRPSSGDYTMYSPSQVEALEETLAGLPFQVDIESSTKDRKQRLLRAVARDENGNRLKFVIRFGTNNSDLKKYFGSEDGKSFEHETIPGIGTIATSSPDSGYGATAEMYAQMIDAACVAVRGESCNLP
jgi:hypothetical protein